VTAVLFAQLDQGLVVVCGRVDGRTYRWETQSGGLLGETGGSGPAIRAMAGGPAANRFMAVMGLDDGRLMRWDVSGDTLVGDPMPGHENGTLALAMVERDGRPSAVSGGGDQAIRLWDMEKGEQVGQPWRGHSDNITALAVSEFEGRQLVISGSSDGGLRIWDPETGQPVGEEHEAHAGSVNALATGVVDGQAVLFSGGDEQAVRTWHLAELVPRKRVGSKVEWKNDSPARIDLLRHQELAGVLARRLRRIHNDHPRHSFLIHVDGPWGSGKSTLLGFLGRILDPEMALSETGEAEAASATQRPTSGKVQDDSGQADRPADWMVIWFDAWRQEGIGPPWWTLLASLREQMDRRRSWGERTMLRLRESLFKIRLAGSSYLLAIIIMLLLLAGIYILLLDVETLSLKEAGDAAKTISAVIGTLVILWTGARVASKFFLWDSAKGAQIFEQSTRDPMQSAAEHFSWLLYQVGKPVVFFVDDLDRCDETYVVKLLESIQTLIRDVHLKEAQGQSGLSNPPSGQHRKKASYGPHFIVAADGAWIRKSFAKSFENFTGAVDEPGRPLGYLFLDKLFQITVPMPYLSPELQRRYFGGLLGVSGNGSEAEQGDDEENIEEEVAAAVERVQASDSDAEVMQVFRDASDQVRSRIAGPVVRRLTDEEVETAREHELQKFAELLDPNPRSMKRFLNAYSIMLSIQPLQLNAVSVDTLALWTVLRLRWPALADYLLASPRAIKDVSRDGPVPENTPAQIRELFSDPAVVRVVNFEKGGPLTPAAIREVASLASPAEGEAAEEAGEPKPNEA
jgi:signal transduction histidine kinase